MHDTPFSFVTTDAIHLGTLDLDANLLFKTASDFSHFIEQKAINEGRTCVQVILDYCDDRDIEPDDVSKLISLSLRGKIQMEMIDAGLLPDHNQLDI